MSNIFMTLTFHKALLTVRSLKVKVMMFNTTFNNISAISWWSVLETGFKLTTFNHGQEVVYILTTFNHGQEVVYKLTTFNHGQEVVNKLTIFNHGQEVV
jgi:hypothetical protein